MARRRPSTLPLLAVLALLVACATALKFDLFAQPATQVWANRKCISHFVPNDKTVLITVKVDDGYNQRVDLEVGIV
ncbi:hypothetical protein BC938DRAFT_475467 [Jimgerdemannia flammicorona]|uniref:GOLD domain-containing protein n=1 Tax=Jimgerdemannia flammicorona TaxID=994334 RepID=A0A433PUC1_9FUNG|nr:hypothetical protein BC938DRAFT_475467 [Jimgerdemannia flammicorona]